MKMKAHVVGEGVKANVTLEGMTVSVEPAPDDCSDLPTEYEVTIKKTGDREYTVEGFKEVGSERK